MPWYWKKAKMSCETVFTPVYLFICIFIHIFLALFTDVLLSQININLLAIPQYWNLFKTGSSLFLFVCLSTIRTKHAKHEEKPPAVFLLGGDMLRDILSLREKLESPRSGKTQLKPGLLKGHLMHSWKGHVINSRSYLRPTQLPSRPNYN